MERIALAALAAGAALAQPVDFARQVYPLLESKCSGCHGPKMQMGRLRLDSKKAFETGGQSGPAASQLVDRVTASNGKTIMPPVGARLDDAEVALLRRWVGQGAPWPEGVGAADATIAQHWAYQPIQRPSLPAVQDARWPRQKWDAFVLARLEAARRRPGAEASRQTLARRLALDLTGLPPSPEEVRAFVDDASADAYDKYVDRLLASPHYGERWAQLWLDLARYADTNGYESDEPRTHWAWRDWVIGAFNRNLAFDRFTIEQIAGDLLPGATEQQVIATGFHRNTLVNSEAGSKDDEFRDAAVKDRVDTTATVWLGSTFGCAQCHNHKYDPFTIRDYYRFYAFFNSTAESAIEVNQTHKIFRGDEAERARLKALVAPLRARLDTATPELDLAQQEWERDAKARLPELERSWRAAGSASTERRVFTLDAPARAFRLNHEGTLELHAYSPEEWSRHEATLAAAPQWGDWYEIGPFEAFTVDEAFATAWPPEREVDLAKTYENGKYAWKKRRPITEGVNDFLDGYNCAVYLYREVNSPAAQRIRIAIASTLGVEAWLNGKRIVHSGPLTGIAPDKALIEVDLQAGSNRLLIKYVNSSGYYFANFRRARGLAEEARVELRKVGRLLIPSRQLPAGTRVEAVYRPGRDVKEKEAAIETTPLDATLLAEMPDDVRAALEAAVRAPEHARALAAHYRWVSPMLASTRAEYEQRKKELDAYVEANSTSSLVLKELDTPRETWIQTRGNFLTKVDNVAPGTPAILPAITAAPPNRLGLAQWIVDRNNPLTARVVANHFWRAIFAVGLVKTGEDFGSQGDRPLDPRLLDWLAAELMDNNWDLKKFLKTIVTSATYRQSSNVDAATLARDPENKLLGRYPRTRLGAEAVRDTVLAVSGLLSRKVGGPSVFPPVPAQVFDSLFIEGGFQAWPTSTGEDRYRRGLYTFVKRTALYPPFMAFDAPDRTQCTVDRPRSNTPLQALTTLNDEAFLEAAGALAPLIKEQGIAAAFERATARRPTPQEAASVDALIAKMRARYAADAEAARKLARAARAPSPNLAPWIVAANVILNLDETITKE